MKYIYYLCSVVLSLLMFGKSYGQLNPLAMQYYQNEYAANPALAGREEGWRLNVGAKAQWTSFREAPMIQNVTLDHGSTGNVGLGLNFYNDQAGIMRQTSLKATYAYHLRIGNGEQKYLDFGLSAGLMNEWIDLSRAIGAEGDLSLYNFNARKMYLDADFGLAYRVDALKLQGSIPNLKRFLQRDMNRSVVDRTLFMAAISYQVKLDDDGLSGIEPKVMIRGIQNFKPIVDVAANISLYDHKLSLMSIYHSTRSMTFGVGTKYQSFSINTMYTTNTGDLQSYANGEFEIGLKYGF